MGAMHFLVVIMTAYLSLRTWQRLRLGDNIDLRATQPQRRQQGCPDAIHKNS
jgi:hypothetical protein